MDRIAGPLAKRIDAEVFGGQPPKVVTFDAIDAIIRRDARSRPDREEIIESMRYFDSLLVSSGVLDGVEVGSLELLDGTARLIRRAAERLPKRTGEEAELDVEAARTASRALAFQVVAIAWLLHEQLLVVDLALALGIDPIPAPSFLKSAGDA